jgi:hypothetical protein
MSVPASSSMPLDDNDTVPKRNHNKYPYDDRNP